MATITTFMGQNNSGNFDQTLDLEDIAANVAMIRA
jgi:hypothetical protein